MTTLSPEALAQEQLDAYNAHDLDRFCAVYADDITLTRLPAGEPFLVGKAALRQHYANNRFNMPGLHADLVNRMVMGNKVLDHERIHGVRPEAFETVAVYECGEGLIRRAWFIDPQ
jgi:hypothetical protein